MEVRSCGGFCNSGQLSGLLVSKIRAENRSSYLEEVLGGSGFDGAVLDLGLLGEVVGGVDRREHALDGKERGEVGRVGRDDDESKEPPRTADDSTS